MKGQMFPNQNKPTIAGQGAPAANIFMPQAGAPSLAVTQKKPSAPSPIEQNTATIQNYAKNFLARTPNAPTPTKIDPRNVASNNVFAQSVQGQQLGPVQGMDNMQAAVGAATRNAQTAGQVDPNVAKFLQAAQASGQYSPQAMSQMAMAAQGQGPSAAQAQMQAGTDQAIRAQMAMASSRGFNPAAIRGAQMQGAEMLQQSANQAAQLRAQEQQAAQQAFLQASLQQEEMQRQAAMQAAGVTLDQSVASQQARQAAINSQLQGAGQFAGLGLDAATTQAGLNQQALLANQDAFLRAGMANQGASLQASLANQDAAIKSGALNNEAALAAWAASQNAGQGWAGMGMGGLTDLLRMQTGMQEAENQRRFENRMADVGFGRNLLGGIISGGAGMGAAFLGRGK